MPSDDKDIPSPFAQTASGTEQTDTRQRIVTAAAELFSKNGYSRSTTRGIAKAAGLSEVTLFRHFDSKESLFKSVMEAFGNTFIVRTIENRLTGDYRADLLMIGNFFAQIMLERAETVCTVVNEARHFPLLRPLIAQLPASLWRMLAGYLEKKMEEGVVRPIHPQAVAQAFFASFYGYAVQKKILVLEPKPEITAQEFVEQIVDVFVKGTIAQ